MSQSKINQHRTTLLQLARQSIEHSLTTGEKPTINLEDYADDYLKHNAASFVTLHLNNQLRGCIGQLEATRPLVIDVAMNAYAAAFSDPRFPPVTEQELPLIHISISVLTKPQLMHVENEEALYSALRPGVDGLIIQKGNRRGTYLPSVWEQLPNPKEFVEYLKRKAGIGEDDNSGMQYWNYQTEYIEE